MLFISIGGGGYKIVTSFNKKCLHLNQKGKNLPFIGSHFCFDTPNATELIQKLNCRDVSHPDLRVFKPQSEIYIKHFLCIIKDTNKYLKDAGIQGSSCWHG